MSCARYFIYILALNPPNTYLLLSLVAIISSVIMVILKLGKSRHRKAVICPRSHS